MTFEEKLQQDCPGLSDKAVKSIIAVMCPYSFGYEKRDKSCMEFDDAELNCFDCWKREIPGTSPINKTTLEPPAPTQEDI
jgi:hypothetical protein